MRMLGLAKRVKRCIISQSLVNIARGRPSIIDRVITELQAYNIKWFTELCILRAFGIKDNTEP